MLKLLIFFSLIGFTNELNITPVDFSLPIYGEKKEVDLKDFKGKKVLINFWASWCTSCIEEVGELNALMKSDKSSHYEFIGINAGDSSKKIKRFIKRHNFKYKILSDKNRETSKSWGVHSLPITVILDKDGKLIYKGIRPPKSLL